MIWRLLPDGGTIGRLHSRSRAWLVLIVLEIVVILTVGGLVIGSLYLRSYTHDVCSSLNRVTSYAERQNDLRITTLRRAIQTDMAAGRMRKVRDDRAALKGAIDFRDAIRPPNC